MINDPVSTRTGIVIGGAYVPRRSPRYADPIEVHPVTRAGHRLVPWFAAIALFAMLLSIAGCSNKTPAEEAAATAERKPATIVQVNEHWTDIARYGPDEYGVACYRSLDGVSCVKVK